MPSGQLLFVNISWIDLEQFPAVLRNWLSFLDRVANADPRIAFDVLIFTDPSSPFLMIYGSFNGPEADFNASFTPWLSEHPRPDFFTVHPRTQFEMIAATGAANYPFPAKERQHIVSALALNISETMIDVLLEPQPNTTFPMLQYIDIIYLHKTNKDKNTAWPFPDISFDIAPGFAWFTADDDATAIDVAEEWLNRLSKDSSNVVGAYLNYIDPYMDQWQTLYYRQNWGRLREIKGQWDPKWYFRFPQGIPPSTIDNGERRTSFDRRLLLLLLLLLLLSS